MLRVSFLVLFVAVTLSVGALAFLLQVHPDFEQNTPLDEPGDKPLRMLFLGTSSMAWTDGKSTWLVDGFFSRQSIGKVLLSRLEVDETQVNNVAGEMFRQLQMPSKLSGIVVAHSHYDHAMDAPYLVKQYGGRVVGSESTWQIAKGQNLPALQMEVVEQQGVATLGDFGIELLQSAHAPTGFTGGFNTKPVGLPAHALSFKEGISYSFVVSHPMKGQRPFVLIQSSAGFVPGQNKNLTVDTVLLGAGGLGKLSEQYIADYWQEMVLNTEARQVYLIHWDDFTLPLMQQGELQAFKPMPSVLDNFPRSLELLRQFAERDGVKLKVLNAWEMVHF